MASGMEAAATGMATSRGTAVSSVVTPVLVVGGIVVCVYAAYTVLERVHIKRASKIKAKVKTEKINGSAQSRDNMI